jgi:hypothetical protein
MHRAYCDESEDKQGRTIFAVSGYLGSNEAWRSFEIMWKDALADERIPEFHASKCDGGHGIFHGMSEERRAGLQRRFYSIVNNVMGWGFSSAVRLGAYDMVRPQFQSARGDLWKPYFLLFQHQIELMTMVLEDADRPPDERIVFTFDRQQEYQHQGRANRLYNSLAKDADKEALKFARRLGGLFFASRLDEVQLQAADILAYENMRYLRDECWPGHPERERWQWKHLRASKRMRGNIFEEAQLGELLRLTGWAAG